ncbi:MAG: hypothetical protein WDZ76_10035 [Pseudohongiellaceae bacterium]
MRTVRLQLFIMLGVFSCAPVLAQEGEQRRDWQELVNADRLFASQATSVGRTTAFLEVLGPDSVVFREGPVDARSLYQTDEFRRSVDQMAWNSHYVDISRAGDLGLTAGPTRLTAVEGEGDSERQAFGYMIGVWRKIDGDWMLMADIVVRIPGILSVDVMPRFSDTLLAREETAHPVMARENTQQDLIDADNLFGLSINYRGGQRALLRYGLENQRVYLPGMAPAVGIEAASTVYGKFLDNQLSTTNPVSLTYMGGYLAESGELGYTYGVMATSSDESDAGFRTNYLRLWRFTESNEWKIALEVLRPF